LHCPSTRMDTHTVAAWPFFDCVDFVFIPPGPAYKPVTVSC
jgi:hypothetical protein